MSSTLELIREFTTLGETSARSSANTYCSSLSRNRLQQVEGEG